MPQPETLQHYSLPWYDASWLCCYYHARDIVKSNYPNRLAEFDDAFEVLRTDPNFKVKDASQLVQNDVIKDLKKAISELTTEQLETHEFVHFGRSVVHNLEYANELQQTLTDQVSALAGETLEPSYNFLALYNNLGFCQPHMDAPNAKWTLDICIEQSQEWPIYFSQVQSWPDSFELAEDPHWQKTIVENPDNQFTEQRMMAGNALLFSGSSQWHYRPRIQQLAKQNFCHLLFLHYIPKGTRKLVNPNLWANLFAMPDLEQITFEL